MKRAWLALAMLVPLFSGCLTGDDDPEGAGGPAAPVDPGYDAEDLAVTGVATHDLTIPSGDIELSAILYEPLTTDSIRGENAVWPLVVFVHPWGFPKETYENAPLSTDGQAGPPENNLLQMFAEAGLMSVAYDTRGWGESGGQSTVAGEAEMRDLQTVIDHVTAEFQTNGFVGVVGQSYGGAHAFLAWERLVNVTTAVSMNGWVDLYEGVFPGNTPKLQWGTELYATGEGGAGGDGVSPEVRDWMATAVSRQAEEDMDPIERQLDSRSILLHGAQTTDKPLFVCQAMQDSLFNGQAHIAWQNAPGFVRAKYVQGGHNTFDTDCWNQARDWFLHFLAGIDHQVDQWSFLETVDASGEGPARQYTQASSHNVALQTLYLREGQLVLYDDPERTFNIAQRGFSNPFTEPSALYENTGQPYQQVPEQFRQDPSAVFFESAVRTSTGTLFGDAEVSLVLHEDSDAPYQVAATLYHKQDGSLRIIGQGATNPLGPGDLMDRNATIQLPWVKLDIHPGDQLVLKLASNDPSMYAPYFANYDVDFTGESSLTVSYFAPPARGG